MFNKYKCVTNTPSMHGYPQLHMGQAALNTEPKPRATTTQMAMRSFTIYSKLARIHKAGCHTAALTGCGGRESGDGGYVGEYRDGWGAGTIRNE